jgi:Carboxypeptidase regulatory-like domain/TonB-dependent Receptor Plug Domain
MTDAKRVFNRRLSFAGLNGVFEGSLFTGPRTLFWLVTILLLLCPITSRAQELAATLSGTVTDSSSAVIPNAVITITQNGVNGTARVLESDGYGNYTAPNLPPGTYSVKVVASGFETYIGKNIVLNVAEKHAFNIQLKAGSVTTTVEVEDNPVSVDTESSAQASTISGQQVRELELSSRSFEQLVTLQPGVVNQLGDEVGAGGTALAVNGARTTANNWTVDGADINDSGSNGTITNEPSVDAIQEFTLQRGTYDAGYGRSGGGQVLVATKAGTSSFHGDAYEFVRNTDLDANYSFNKPVGIARGVNHHNDYGFTIGGPVYIPKVYNADKNKTFFFWSEEWRKITTPGNTSMAVATGADLAGTIPDTLVGGVYYPYVPSGPNGLSGSCAPVHDATAHTSQIPTSCYSQNSNVYLTNIFANPKYAANSGGNLDFAYSQKNDLHEDIVRVDHYFNEKVHFYARGMNDDMPVNAPMGLWAGPNYPGLVNTLVDSPGKNVVGNLTWSISPKIVNEAEFVYAQGTYNSTIAGGQFATSPTQFEAMTNNWAYTDPYGRMPALNVTGIQGFSPGSAPWKERNLDRSYFDNVAITLGKHTFRTGFQFQQMIKTENAVSGGPTFSFDNQNKNANNAWSFGDFLLGNVFNYNQGSRDIIPDLHYINSEAYVQDDWKLNKKLTINLGVRWSAFPSPADVRNTLNNFDPQIYSASKAPTIDPASGNFNPGQALNGNPLIPATYANGIIFPKGGACTAAQAISTQVTCSPFGNHINPDKNTNFGPRVGFAYNPDGRGITSIRGGFGIFYDRLLNGIWEQNAFQDPPLLQTTTISNTSFDAPSGSNVVSYGPNGLTVTGTPTFKVPSYGNYSLSVERQLLPTTTLEVAYVGNVARHLLGEFDLNQPTMASRTASPNADVNAVRPYLGYAQIHDRGPLFTNNYNSLQISLSHRSTKGLTLGLAYTWSKDLTTNSNDRGSSASNSYDFKLDYGPSSTNTPQMLIVNYIYELPWFKAQRGLEGHILGGWELSGISSFVSGSSFSVTQSSDPFAGIYPNGLGMKINGTTSIRADQTGAIHKPKTLTQWFSTGSFVPAVGHFGTEGSNPLLGPGAQNWDLAGIKNSNLGEHVRFQLRAEFFNAFNHTNFSGVDTVLGDSNFGQVTGAHEPRRIQLGAKLIF